MAGTGSGAPAPVASDYPPNYLADLAVSILGGLKGNTFEVHTALSNAPSSTRAIRAQRGCCLLEELPAAPLSEDMPFYFGRDGDGYVMVAPRISLPGWPTTRGGDGKPVRLTRWLVRAPPGSVVRHTCDTPACIRVSHLVCSTQADNLADAVRRGRRNGRLGERSARIASMRSAGSAPPTPMAADLNFAQRAREARFALTGFGSPSKMARRTARSRLQAASGGRSSALPMRSLGVI